MYLLAQFILQNFKKFLKMIQSYENVPFSDPKWHICLGQKIFGLFYFLAHLVFTTSEMKLDYYHQKVNVRVASQVAKRLKT